MKRIAATLALIAYLALPMGRVAGLVWHDLVHRLAGESANHSHGALAGPPAGRLSAGDRGSPEAGPPHPGSPHHEAPDHRHARHGHSHHGHSHASTTHGHPDRLHSHAPTIHHGHPHHQHPAHRDRPDSGSSLHARAELEAGSDRHEHGRHDHGEVLELLLSVARSGERRTGDPARASARTGISPPFDHLVPAALATPWGAPSVDFLADHPVASPPSAEADPPSPPPRVAA